MLDVLECPFHSGDFTPDRGVIRGALRTITTEATGFLSSEDLVDQFIDPPVALLPYADTPALFPDAYTRVQTLGAFAAATGRFETYVTAESCSQYEKPILKHPFIAVGEYGVAPARRLLAGTLRLLAIADARTMQIQSIANQSSQTRAVVLNHTFQGHRMHDAATGLDITMQQGIVSTAHAIAQLSAERVPGYDWDSLVGELVERDKIAEYTRLIGSGLLPYLTIFGRYVRNSVIPQEGVLDFSSPLRTTLRHNREDFLKVVQAASERLPILAQELEAARSQNDVALCELLTRQYQATHLTASGGGVCPASGREGDVTKAARQLIQLMPQAS